MHVAAALRRAFTDFAVETGLTRSTRSLTTHACPFDGAMKGIDGFGIDPNEVTPVHRDKIWGKA